MTKMLRKHKFKIGQRVRPSNDGITRSIFARTRWDASGVVTKVDRFNFPTVLWDYRKTTSGYHPNFIRPDRRRRSR